jgi:N-acetylglucosamine kinase-like BadF-type ATPase
MTQKRPGRMAKLGEQAYKETEQELADEEVELLLVTSIEWETLRPQVTNDAIYDQLIAAVNEATQRNESIAQLSKRLQQLGEEGQALAKKVIRLLT